MRTLGFVSSRATHCVTIECTWEASTDKSVGQVLSVTQDLSPHLRNPRRDCWRGLPRGGAVEPLRSFRFPTRPHLVGRLVSLVPLDVELSSVRVKQPHV